MQACEICGRDAGDPSGICASCRSSGTDPVDHGEAVLAAVLRSARGDAARPHIGDDRERPVQRLEGSRTRAGRGTASRTAAAGAPGWPSRRGRHDEIVLREVSTAAEEREHDTPIDAPTLSASLIDLLDDGTPMRDDSAPTRDDGDTAWTQASRTDPTAGPRAARERAWRSWAPQPTGPPSPRASGRDADTDPTADNDPTADTDRVARALEDIGDVPARPAPDARDDAPPAVGARPSPRSSAAPTAASDIPQAVPPPSTGPIAGFPHTASVGPPTPPAPAGTRTPAELPELVATAPAPPAPGTGLSPQPPADAPTRRPEPVDDPTTTGATALTSDAPATGDEAAAAGEASDNAAQGDRDGQSWRALFRDNGSWTAVSQVALVIVSVLGVIQVTVLLTIDGHLRDAAGEDADVISPLLVAQDKVGDVMLPGLLGISTVALGFAISRSVAERRAASSDGEQTFVPAMARLPIALWTVTIPLGALLTLVVTWTAPETLEMARFLNRQSLVIVGLLAVTSVLGAAALRPYTAAADGASHDGGRDADDTVAPATG